MKTRILLMFLLGMFALASAAQTRSVQGPFAGYKEVMDKGKSQYNAKKYPQALATFKAALNKYPGKEAEINPWITKTNQRIAEQKAAEARRQREEAERQAREAQQAAEVRKGLPGVGPDLLHA